MDYAWYSLALIVSFAIMRWLTENIKFHIRNEKLWVHHWILAAAAMIPMWWFKVDDPWIWGALTGIALEGLRRKNWSIKR